MRLDHERLALILRAELDSRRRIPDQDNLTAANIPQRVVENIAHAFARVACQNQGEFLRACGI